MNACVRAIRWRLPISPRRAYQPLVRWLRRAFPEVDDPAFYFDAATEAILNYAERPAIFDPARNSLSGFLRMSAAGDLRNCLSRQRRVRNYEVPVESSDDDGNIGSEEPFRPFEWNDEEELLIRQIDGARLVGRLSGNGSGGGPCCRTLAVEWRTRA